MDEVYDFGLRLKKLREARKLSQVQAAKKLGITRSTISGYERNMITPSLDIVARMAILYKASLDYIMGLDNRPSIYMDGLSESQQQTRRDVVERLKLEFRSENSFR